MGGYPDIRIGDTIISLNERALSLGFRKAARETFCYPFLICESGGKERENLCCKEGLEIH